MSEISYLLDVLLPIVVIGAFAWVVPLYLSKKFPETLTGLWSNGLVSAACLSILSGIALLVAWGQIQPSLWPLAWVQGLKFSLVWAPIGILSLVMQPQKWTLEE